MKHKIFTTIFICTFLYSHIHTFAQWKQVGYMITGSDTAVYPYTVKAFGSDVYSGTDKGLFKSSDNGDTWQSILSPAIIRCVLVASNGDIYAGSDKRLYKSTDNGANWSWLNTLTDSMEFNSITELNGNILISYRKDTTGGVYYSSNGGANWTLATGLINKQMNGFFIDGSTVYLGGINGIYKSMDNGQTWTVAGTGFPAACSIGNIVKLGNVFFSGDWWGNGLYASYDNANTWANIDTSVFKPFCQVFEVETAGNMILASNDGGCNPGGISIIKMSNDTGKTWNAFINGDLQTQTCYLRLGRNTAGTSFFTKECFGKKVFRYDLTTGISSINKEQLDVEIYPNPFSENAMLRITNGYEFANKNLELKIYNLLGQTVKQYSNITIQQFTIARDGLTDGIYFYKIQNQNSTLATGKLVIQ